MHRSAVVLLTLCIGLIAFPPNPTAAPLSPGFTYQGLYEEDGMPAEGSFHPRFSLWDAATEGAQVGASQTIPDTPLVNGVFTVILNASGEFGSNAFNGEARWLQIEICSDEICSVTTVLGPRQPITGAPYALGPWIRSATGDLSYEGGRVGIGSASPSHQLRVSGGPVWTSNAWQGSVELNNAAAIGWRTNDAGNSFGVGQSNGGLYFFRTASVPGTATSPANYDMTISDQGLVGIGEYSFSDRLLVIGGDLIGTAAFGSTSKGPHYSHIHFGTNGDWYIRSAATFGKVILQDSGGSVGVGTTSPQAKFHSVGGGLIGLYGQSSDHFGVYGLSQTNVGLRGLSTSHIGVYGTNSGGSAGVYGNSPFVGVQGVATGNATDRQAVRGENGGSNTGYAGLFLGNGWVTGTLTKGGGAFKIDHPLEPETKFLSHSFVESPDMMNIYNGNVTTDAEGYADIPLPEWFEALNRDFRYQLTVIDEEDADAFTQAKVVKKIASNRFTIRTSRPNTEVSWQVTGIRQDPWANANRIQVEEEKTPEEKGKFLHPQALGIGKADGSDYASVALPILVPVSAK